MSERQQPVSAATAVVAAALALFEEQGFEQTSVDQIAKAAGVSRSTFFRQFGGKDDVVFADHEIVLAELREYLDERHANPWLTVTEGAMIVFKRMTADPEVARKRYELVRRIPALREREIVTVFRYERLFDEYLRGALPNLDPVDAVGYAALIAAVHNHVLRQVLRGKRVSSAQLRTTFDNAMRRFGVADERSAPATDDMVVAVFPRSMPAAEVGRRVQEALG